MRVCSVEGCSQQHRASGLCKMHYDRVRSTGSTDLQPLPEHGEERRYDRGCRCDLCKAANTSRHKRQRAERYNRAVPEGVIHGLSVARNWGCKCDICKAAVKDWNQSSKGDPSHPLSVYYAKNKNKISKRVGARMKRINDETRIQAHRCGEEWTGPELEGAARLDLTAEQAALMIGRTASAVHRIRGRLAKNPREQRMANMGPGYQS